MELPYELEFQKICPLKGGYVSSGAFKRRLLLLTIGVHFKGGGIAGTAVLCPLGGGSAMQSKNQKKCFKLYFNSFRNFFS